MSIYTIAYKFAQLTTAQFLQRYQKDAFLQYCASCPRYNACWSCPPLAAGAKDCFADFSQLLLIGLQLNYSAAARKKTFAPQALSRFALHCTSPVKNGATAALIELEKSFAPATSLASGGCELCRRCTRNMGQPCCQPDRLRYSLDAFGVDLGSCAQRELGLELLWSQTTLPAYHLLLHAFCTNEPVDPEAFAPQLQGLLTSFLAKEHRQAHQSR